MTNFRRPYHLPYILPPALIAGSPHWFATLSTRLDALAHTNILPATGKYYTRVG